MELSGHTKSFAVLGHPIGHTLSPAMHNAAFKALGMDAIYLAFDVAPDNLMAALSAMATMGFGGANLTVPLKEVALRGLEQVDESARVLGAVNTVEFSPNGLKGYNTDGHGILRALNEAFGYPIKGLTAFILGTGGAGRAVAITLAMNGASRITLADSDGHRPAKVAREISDLGCAAELRTVQSDPVQWQKASLEAELVVQATPVGMKDGERSLLEPKAFRQGQMVFDLIYMFPETPFMKAARNAKANTANGLGMLLHQGARSFEIWTGKKPDTEVMRKALAERVYGQAQ